MTAPGTGHSPYGFPQQINDANGVAIRSGGERCYLRLAISYATADAAVLYTVPTGLTIAMFANAMWEVTTAWTGGSSSAIGISSSATGYTTKGDVHGGATGDVLATLTAGFKQGTLGAKVSAAPKCVVLAGGSTIRFDQVTSTFTAGAGYIHLPFFVVA
jgi:hypothetical protein